MLTHHVYLIISQQPNPFNHLATSHFPKFTKSQPCNFLSDLKWNHLADHCG